MRQYLYNICLSLIRQYVVIFLTSTESDIYQHATAVDPNGAMQNAIQSLMGRFCFLLLLLLLLESTITFVELCKLMVIYFYMCRTGLALHQ